jgi:2-desacetyl-2-hydroxyethyl bacteriochlorophyllide A dehydrogenase
VRSTVVFPRPRQVELVEEPDPSPGPDQVLVEGVCSLISTGTELTAFSGDFPPDSAWSRYIRYPFHPGYSHVGRTMRVGSNLDGVQPGDRLSNRASHTTRAAVGPEGLVTVPEGVGDEEAAFVELGCTVMNGVRLADIALGEAVVVIGAGLLGQLAISLASLSGAWPVIAVDRAETRLALARQRGANHALAVDVSEAREAVHEVLGGHGADVVFEVTGSPRVAPAAMRLARRRGRVILLGSPRGSSQIDLHDEIHTLGLQVIGAHTSTQPEHDTPYNPWTRARNAALFLDLVAAGRLDVASLVSHRFWYRDARSAYEMLLADRTQAMGVLFTYGERTK